MKTLYFYLEAPHQFFVLEQVKEATNLLDSGEFESLDGVLELARECDRNVAIVSGESVSIFEVDLPIRSRKKAIQAIPFALEDQVAGSIDDLHFHLLNWQAGAVSTVAVMQRDWWFQHLLWMEENNIEIQQILPEFALLPLAEEEAAFLFMEENSDKVSLIFRQNDQIKGLNLMLDELSFWGDDFDAQGKNIVCNDSRLLAQILQSENLSQNTVNQVSVVSLMELCVQQPQENSHRSFLQLYSSDRTRRDIEKSKPWFTMTVACLILALLVNIGIDLYQYRILRLQEQALNQRIEEIFQKTFPQVTRIVDARLQFQRELNTLKGNTRGSQEFLSLLDTVTTSVPKQQVRVEELFYRNSALNVTLKADDFQILDRFTKKLDENKSVAHERLSSDSQGGKVTARYRLSVTNQ